MQVFVNPHSGAEVDSWNIGLDEQEQVTVVRNGRAYVLLFGETLKLEIWSVENNGDFKEVLKEIDIPVFSEQLEFDFVKTL